MPAAPTPLSPIPGTNKQLKVAIVCDWLLGIGGAERVVLEMHRLFPQAPIYTSQYDPSKIDWFKDADVRTTWLQKLPKVLKKFLPVLRAWTFSHLDLSQYDIVLSSSGAEAKAVKTGPNTIHISYCHAPTHYYWSRYDEYLKAPGFGLFNPLARFGLIVLAGPMRLWDLKAAQRPTHMIANSTHIQAAIQEYYGRESVVIHPPVDTARFKPTGREQRHGVVVAGRQTPYKKIDLAVQACSELGMLLKVIGSGPDHEKLRTIAGSRTIFIANSNDQQIAQHFREASVCIFPGLDDFGIVAVEAMAAGTPVIAYKAGGAVDYIKEGVTGTFFTEQTVESLVKVLHNFRSTSYDPKVVSAHAQQFSIAAFRRNLATYMQQIVTEKYPS